MSSAVRVANRAWATHCSHRLIWSLSQSLGKNSLRLFFRSVLPPEPAMWASLLGSCHLWFSVTWVWVVEYDLQRVLPAVVQLTGFWALPCLPLQLLPWLVMSCVSLEFVAVFFFGKTSFYLQFEVFCASYSRRSRGKREKKQRVTLSGLLSLPIHTVRAQYFGNCVWSKRIFFFTCLSLSLCS